MTSIRGEFTLWSSFAVCDVILQYIFNREVGWQGEIGSAATGKR